MEQEITSPIAIADPRGRLVREAVGWSRHPLHLCALSPKLTRVARFNYWCISNRSCALTLLLADVGYFGFALVSFLDFNERSPLERFYLRPGGLPFQMPDTPRGDLVLDVRRLRLSMRNQAEKNGGEMQVDLSAHPLFGKPISAQLTVARPRAHETVNVLVPFDDTRFHFTSKQQALPVRGEVRVGSKSYFFDAKSDSFACLDFGRGRWPKSIDWNWGFAAAMRSGRTIGLNLGGKWTDGTGVTENGIVIDGRVHKIADAVDFGYDVRGWMKPWTIRTRTTERLDLKFVPLRERSVKLPLGFIGMELHQMMGSYSGTFVDDSGATVAIDDMVGLAESFRGEF